jgi:uncharacterized protein YraI
MNFAKVVQDFWIIASRASIHTISRIKLKERQHVKVYRIFLAILMLIFGSIACNFPSAQNATPDAYTAAAMTVTALAATNAFTTPSATVTAITPTLISTSTPLFPVATVVVAASSTPSGTLFVVDVGANCRTGPGTNYDKVTAFAQGTYLSITGRNADSTWWVVQNGSGNCWISAITGHTSGSTASVAVVAAPPTPTVVATATGAAGPILSDPVALVAELSYPNNCTSNTLSVAIRVTDAGKGVNSVWLSYRYVGDNGYTGSWHIVSPNDSASGGVNGFNYPIGTEAASELGTQNGTFQYQFFAKDNSGNQSAYPASSPLGIPIKYCTS